MRCRFDTGSLDIVSETVIVNWRKGCKLVAEWYPVLNF